MDKVLTDAGLELHPSCDRSTFAEPEGEHPIRQKLIDMIMWADQNSPRSLQVAIGPSELGDECDRRVGYRMAGIEEVNNRNDPWAAIVGTAIHQWTEKAVIDFQKAHGTAEWETEVAVQPDPLVIGHSDYFYRPESMVVDLKSSGNDVLKKIHKDGPPEGYKTQVQIYGLGYERAGIEVKKVALVFVPRAGWLSDMHVWTAPYDRAIAEKALTRMYRIGGELIDLDIMNQPHRWQQVEATPSRNCAFCSWRINREPDLGADNTGCPGQ